MSYFLLLRALVLDNSAAVANVLWIEEERIGVLSSAMTTVALVLVAEEEEEVFESGGTRMVVHGEEGEGEEGLGVDVFLEARGGGGGGCLSMQGGPDSSSI